MDTVNEIVETNNVNKEKKLSVTLLVYVALALLFAVAGCALRAANISLFYDNDIGYYEAEAVLPLIMNIFFCAAALFLVLGAILLVRTKHIPTERMVLGVRITAIIPAAVFFAYAVVAIIRIITCFSFGITVDLLTWLSLPSALGGAGYFTLTALNKRNNGPALALGFLTIVWFVVAIGLSYFDQYVQMNAPDKIMFQLACIGGMALILGELRSVHSGTKKRLCLFSNAVACLFLASSSIASIIGQATVELYNYVLLMEDIVCLSVLVFAVAKLISLSLPEKEVIEMVEEVEVTEDNAEVTENTEDTETAEETEEVEKNKETEETEETESNVTTEEEQ